MVVEEDEPVPENENYESSSDEGSSRIKPPTITSASINNISSISTKPQNLSVLKNNG
jgi:hypothetical protein